MTHRFVLNLQCFFQPISKDSAALSILPARTLALFPILLPHSMYSISWYVLPLIFAIYGVCNYWDFSLVGTDIAFATILKVGFVLWFTTVSFPEFSQTGSMQIQEVWRKNWISWLVWNSEIPILQTSVRNNRNHCFRADYTEPNA